MMFNPGMHHDARHHASLQHYTEISQTATFPQTWLGGLAQPSILPRTVGVISRRCVFGVDGVMLFPGDILLQNLARNVFAMALVLQ